MYKIDNKNRRAKIKNLEKRLDFQKYNIKEKKQKEKGKKKKKAKKKKATRIIKKKNKTPITTQRLYMVFALKTKKKKVFFF